MITRNMIDSCMRIKIENWFRNQYNAYKYASIISPKFKSLSSSLNHGNISEFHQHLIVDDKKVPGMCDNNCNRNLSRRSKSLRMTRWATKLRSSSQNNDVSNVPIYPTVLKTFEVGIHKSICVENSN